MEDENLNETPESTEEEQTQKPDAPQQTIKKLRERIGRLENALQPFSRIFIHQNKVDDNYVVYARGDHQIKAGHVRRAIKILDEV